MKRRRFYEREVIETLWYQGVHIPCFRCKKILLPKVVSAGRAEFRVQREHIHEIALGGIDRPINCRFSHIDCHAIVTNGTKATTAGSSKGRIAKTKRIAKGKMAVRKPTPPDPLGDGSYRGPDERPKRTLPSRGFAEKPEGFKYRWGR